MEHLEKRVPTVVAAAWVIFAVAWFLPVYQGGQTLSDGTIPGLQAFRVALGDSELGWQVRSVPILTALSNGLLLVSVVLFLRRTSDTPPQWLAWSFLVATLLNTMWIFLSGSVWDLRIGYWLWLLSFALVTVGLFGLRRDAEAELSGA